MVMVNVVKLGHILIVYPCLCVHQFQFSRTGYGFFGLNIEYCKKRNNTACFFSSHHTSHRVFLYLYLEFSI